MSTSKPIFNAASGSNTVNGNLLVTGSGVFYGNVTVDGTLQAAAIAGGVFNPTSVSTTQVTTTNLHVTNNAQVDGNANVTGTLTTGTFNPSTISTTALTVSGTSSLQGTVTTGAINAGTNSATVGVLTFGGASGTSLTSSGNVALLGPSSSGTLALTSQIPGSSPSFTALTVTGTSSLQGTITCGSITSSGSITTGSLGSTSITNSGALSTVGLTTTGAIAAGTNSLTCGAVSATSVNSSGTLAATDTSISGSTTNPLVVSTSTTSNTQSRFYSPNLPTLGTAGLAIGTGTGTNNSAQLVFLNSGGSGSATNSTNWQIAGNTNTIQMTATEIITTSGLQVGTGSGTQPLTCGVLSFGGSSGSTLTSGGPSVALTGPASSGTLALTSQLPGSTPSYTTLTVTGTSSLQGTVTTGAITAGTNSITCGALNATSVVNSGTESNAGMTVTGAISAGTNSITCGALSASSVTSSGTLSATDSVVAGSTTSPLNITTTATGNGGVTSYAPNISSSGGQVSLTVGTGTGTGNNTHLIFTNNGSAATNTATWNLAGAGNGITMSQTNLTTTSGVTVGATGTQPVACGALTCSSVTNSGTESNAGITSTGAISNGTNALTCGTISCGSITSSGTVKFGGATGTTLTSGGNVAITGPASSGTLALTNQLSSNSYAVFSSGSFTGSGIYTTYTKQAGTSDWSSSGSQITTTTTGVTFVVTCYGIANIPTLTNASLANAGTAGNVDDISGWVYNGAATTQTLSTTAVAIGTVSSTYFIFSWGIGLTTGSCMVVCQRLT